MRYKHFHQLDSADCGPTCLRMICNFYGKTISLESIRKKSGIGKHGVNLLGLGEAAESLKFRTQAVKVSFEALRHEALLPAILHWNQNHFVVLFKITKSFAIIGDPADIMHRIPIDVFINKWIPQGIHEGIALLLEPTSEFERASELDAELDNSSKHSIFQFYTYLKPHRSLITQLLIGIAIASLLQIVSPLFVRSIVDVGVQGKNIEFVYVILFAQLFLLAGRLAVEFVRTWILLQIGTRINVSILDDFLIKLMKLPVSFFESRKTGDILQRMNDHKRIQNFLTGTSLQVLFSLLNLIIFSIILAKFNSAIFGFFLLSSLLYAGWVLLFLKARKALHYRQFDLASRDQGLTIQIVQGMQEIKLLGIENRFRVKWQELQARLFRSNVRSLQLSQFQQSGAFFINEGKNVLITILSALAVIENRLTLGEMLAVQYMVGQLNSPVEQIVGFIQNFQNATISADRLNEIHKQKDEEGDSAETLKAFHFETGLSTLQTTRTSAQANRDEPSPVKFSPITKNKYISLQNISFVYPGAEDRLVLNNISFKIPLYKTTAIVGNSGSGKTTLLKLLLKYYNATGGTISIDGVNLNLYSHRFWRSQCGAVLQESFLFSDTVANNITLGDELTDILDLNHALEMANLKAFVDDLPLGIHTRIGPEGDGLSMGQKQRILIARTIYRSPSFVFFDEATNSLDATNESEILHNLSHVLNHRTIIVVAHRLSTVKNADHIVVLKKGLVVEQGTHSDLLRNLSEYYHLVKDQLELESDGYETSQSTRH